MQNGSGPPLVRDLYLFLFFRSVFHRLVVKAILLKDCEESGFVILASGDLSNLCLDLRKM